MTQAPGTTPSLISCVTSGKWLALSEPLFLAGNVRALRHAVGLLKGLLEGTAQSQAQGRPPRSLSDPCQPHQHIPTCGQSWGISAAPLGLQRT